MPYRIDYENRKLVKVHPGYKMSEMESYYGTVKEANVFFARYLKGELRAAKCYHRVLRSDRARYQKNCNDLDKEMVTEKKLMEYLNKKIKELK